MKTHPLRAAARLKVEAVPLGTFMTVQVTAAIRGVIDNLSQLRSFYKSSEPAKVRSEAPVYAVAPALGRRPQLIQRIVSEPEVPRC